MLLSLLHTLTHTHTHMHARTYSHTHTHTKAMRGTIEISKIARCNYCGVYSCSLVPYNNIISGVFIHFVFFLYFQVLSNLHK